MVWILNWSTTRETVFSIISFQDNVYDILGIRIPIPLSVALQSFADISEKRKTLLKVNNVIPNAGCLSQMGSIQ